jgi:hypothetical protein
MVAVACGGVDEPAGIAGGWNQSESELATSMDWRYRSSSFRSFLLAFITSVQEREMDRAPQILIYVNRFWIEVQTFLFILDL